MTEVFRQTICSLLCHRNGIDFYFPKQKHVSMCIRACNKPHINHQWGRGTSRTWRPLPPPSQTANSKPAVGWVPASCKAEINFLTNVITSSAFSCPPPFRWFCFISQPYPASSPGDGCFSVEWQIPIRNWQSSCKFFNHVREFCSRKENHHQHGRFHRRGANSPGDNSKRSAERTFI